MLNEKCFVYMVPSVTCKYIAVRWIRKWDIVKQFIDFCMNQTKNQHQINHSFGHQCHENKYATIRCLLFKLSYKSSTLIRRFTLPLPCPRHSYTRTYAWGLGAHNDHEQIFVMNKDCSTLNIELKIAMTNQI